jgi:hypothetical protein
MINMPLNNFKCIVYNKIISFDTDTITYEKVFVYDSVKEKLTKVLYAIPKNPIRGYITIYSFNKKMNLDGKVELNKLMQLNTIKTGYKKFIGDFQKPYYIYHIETTNQDLGKRYDVIFVLIPKKSKFSNIGKLLEKTEISPAIKSAINDMLTEKLKALNYT